MELYVFQLKKFLECNYKNTLHFSLSVFMSSDCVPEICQITSKIAKQPPNLPQKFLNNANFVLTHQFSIIQIQIPCYSKYL